MEISRILPDPDTSGSKEYLVLTNRQCKDFVRSFSFESGGSLLLRSSISRFFPLLLPLFVRELREMGSSSL